MSQVTDKRYANWVKDTLCLLYFKEGLEVFIGSQSANFHAQLKAILGHHTCACSSQVLTREKKGWAVEHCYGLCKDWLDRILSHHVCANLRPPKVPHIAPGNVNPKLWPTDYWEVMKVYQPQGCQDQHSASDADIAALLDLMKNCDHFFPFYNHGQHLINEVIHCFVKQNTDYWEVMKVYQPQGCQDQHSASDADIAALLDLMNKCDHFFPFYSHGQHLINEVIHCFVKQNTDYWEVMKVYQPQGCQDQHSASDADIAALLDLMKNCDHFFPFYNHGQHLINEVIHCFVKQNTDYWEVMKVYQPQGCQDQHSASDADIAALLDLMKNCDHFFPFYNHGQHLINEVMVVRNKLMHSNNFLVEDSDLADDVQKMLTFLRSLASLSVTESQAIQVAIDKTTRLQAKTLDLSLDRELELKAIKASQIALQAEMKNLKQTVTMDTDATRSDLTIVQHQVDAEVKDLQDKVQGVHDKVDTQVDGLKDQMDSSVQDLKHQIGTEVSGLQDQIGTEVSGLKHQIGTEVSGLKHQVGTEVSGLKHQIGTEVACLKHQIGTEVSGLKHQIGTEVSGLKHQIGTEVSGLRHQIGTEVSGRHDKVDKEIQGLQQRLAAHRSRIQELQKELRTQHQSTGNTMFSLTHLQLQLDHLADDLKQVKHKQTALTESNQNQQMETKDIQDHLIWLYSKHCQTIPIYPLQPEWKQHVASLFVLPSMKVTNPRGLSKHHLLMGTVDQSDIKVTSIKDIFPPAGSRCSDIYIMGDAGTGKSTLCEYLVHLWVSYHTSSNQNPGSEENFMKHFELLFFISLREAKSCQVENMIRSQLQLEGIDVAKLLYDHSSLIILDGLDEYSLKQASRTRFSSENLPSRRVSKRCTVLTTSRPWKIELLRRELEDKIERQISIAGLDTESQKKLVRKVLDLLNSEKSLGKTPEDFITEVKTQKLEELMKTPILLMQMLGLWNSGEPLGGSKCITYAKLIDKQIQFTEEVRRSVQNMPETQNDDGTTQQDLFSTFFKDYIYIISYKLLLQKVCRFAYRSLSSKERENSLVFSHDQMELFGMSHEEILLCLDLGLLTQYKVLGEITQRLKYFSFLHRSHQELFAAVYISQIDQADELKQLLNRDFTSLEQVLEMGTVFMFVCGMNPTVARDISRFIMDKASGDARLEHYRQVSVDRFTTDPNLALVKQLQGLILAGIEEGKQNNHKITGMQLQDLYMNVTDDDFPPARVLACTKSLDLSHVKSLYIDDEGAISGDVLQQLLKETSPSLHSLLLYDTVVSVEMIQAVGQQQQGRLQILGLINRNVDNVDFSQLNQTDLQTILSAPTQSLSLHGIDLTHSQLEFLCHHVSNSCYVEVWLGCLQCTTHGYEETECKQLLDLSANRNLSGLQLCQLPVQEVTFVPDNLVSCGVYYLLNPVLVTSMIRCLKRAEKLEGLWCAGLRGSTVAELATTLPHLQHLQYIFLDDINLSVQQQVVQAVGQLKKLECIVLYRVTMREEELRELLAALPSSHRVWVNLGDGSENPVTITGYNRHTDLLGQIRHNPHIHVREDEVEVEGDTCTVKKFWFYTKK